MSDILSKFYKTFYNRSKAINIKENLFIPKKNLGIKTDIGATNLCPYGIYLSDNNTLLISRKKVLPLSLSMNRNLISKKCKSSEKSQIEKENKIEQEKNLTSKSNKDKNSFNTLNPQLNKCFSYKKKNTFLLHKIRNLKIKKFTNIKSNIKTSITNKNVNSYNVNNKKKSRNNFSDFSTIKNVFNNNLENANNNFRSSTSEFNSSRPENKTYYKTITKGKNFFYKETEKDKIKNQIEADKIINELLSFKNKKEIKSYYIKRDYAKAIAEVENSRGNQIFNINNSINPMTYIKFNLKNEPQNISLFKSYDTQVLIMGNKKYRNVLLDGINVYKNNCIQFEDLKGPIGFDKNEINEKKRNEIIKKMKNKFIGERGLFFSNRLFKKKHKKMNDYEFYDNYKNMKKLLYENLNKYKTQIKIENGKRVAINVDPNDINILKKIDGEAEYLIHDKDEMIKFSHRFLSFDEKSNKLVEKTKNTTDYLFKRAQEHHKIKQKIDKLYINL